MDMELAEHVPSFLRERALREALAQPVVMTETSNEFHQTNHVVRVAAYLLRWSSPGLFGFLAEELGDFTIHFQSIGL